MQDDLRVLREWSIGLDKDGNPMRLNKATLSHHADLTNRLVEQNKNESKKPTQETKHKSTTLSHKRDRDADDADTDREKHEPASKRSRLADESTNDEFMSNEIDQAFLDQEKMKLFHVPRTKRPGGPSAYVSITCDAETEAKIINAFTWHEWKHADYRKDSVAAKQPKVRGAARPFDPCWPRLRRGLC